MLAAQVFGIVLAVMYLGLCILVGALWARRGRF